MISYIIFLSGTSSHIILYDYSISDCQEIRIDYGTYCKFQIWMSNLLNGIYVCEKNRWDMFNVLQINRSHVSESETIVQEI